MWLRACNARRCCWASWRSSDRSSSENALWPKQQNNNEYSEGEHALCRWREQQSSQGLGHANQQPTEQCTRHRAQPARDNDDEGQKRVGRTDHRRDIDNQCHHDTGGADASGADSEGECVKPFYIESDNERADIVVGTGTYRLAERSQTKERK